MHYDKSSRSKRGKKRHKTQLPRFKLSPISKGFLGARFSLSIYRRAKERPLSANGFSRRDRPLKIFSATGGFDVWNEALTWNHSTFGTQSERINRICWSPNKIFEDQEEEKTFNVTEAKRHSSKDRSKNNHKNFDKNHRKFDKNLNLVNPKSPIWTE